MGQTTAAKEREDLEDKFFDLSFSVHKSRRYHEKLNAFYGSWRDLAKIVTVIAGSGAFLVLLAGHEGWGQLIVAFVALWAVLDIVLIPDKKAELHKELRQGFTRLAGELETAPRTAESYGNLVAKRLQLEEEEPPCKRLVDLQARNDECRARGFPSDDLVPLSEWQRYLGYLHTFGLARVEKWKSAHEARAASRASRYR